MEGDLTFYPAVLSEASTLERVLAGASLARYGDGEFNLCAGGSIPCQRFDRGLQARLRSILKDSQCLVGIPNIHSLTPKHEFWKKYLGVTPLLADRNYASAFISRPDSAPWINTAEYWARLESLWIGKDVTLVRGSVRSLVAEDLVGAKTVTEIVGPCIDAWADYDQLRRAIGDSKLVLICLGPTATVLAADLCVAGVQAVDLGHAGIFLNKYRRGEPMKITEHDRTLVLKNVRPTTQLA